MARRCVEAQRRVSFSVEPSRVIVTCAIAARDERARGVAPRTRDGTALEEARHTMKQTKTPTKKLALTTQTVRALRADQLDAAAGGVDLPPSRVCTMYIGCTSVICP